MKDELFVDTNVLVYAFDSSEKNKCEISKKIIKQATIGESNAVISNQVLSELFVVLTKKIEKPIEKEKAQIIVNGLIDSTHWKKVNYTTRTASKAINTHIKENTSFWDALIIETMLENNIYTILTENTKDFKHKQIKAKNPFK